MVSGGIRRGWILRGRGRYQLGPRLLCNQSLRLSGPGRIRLGSDVNAWARSGQNRLSTHSPDALIEVGNHVRLNGAGIQAAHHVAVGDDCILATCTLVDTDHHGVDPVGRHRRDAVQSDAIVLERNVWLVGGTMVLKGVTIGEDSIVAFGSIVTSDIPAGVVAAGRPARVVRSLREGALDRLSWRLEFAVDGGGEEGARQVEASLRTRGEEVEDIVTAVVGQGITATVTLRAVDRLDAVRTGMRLVEEALVDSRTEGVVTRIGIVSDPRSS